MSIWGHKEPQLKTPDMTVISLGWGVQSFALAAMSALGLFPKIDYAIHADTGHELSATYEFAKRWTPWLEERGVKVVTTRAPDTGVLRGKAQWCMIPLYLRDDHSDRKGMSSRQCTADWKIRPIRRWIRKQWGGKPNVEMWIGITLDESHRMNDSRAAYIKHVYPFIDFFERPWSRDEVINTLIFLGLEVPPKSSCTFCPHHSNLSWANLYQNHPQDWQDAVQVDELVRHSHKNFIGYVWQQCKPLSELDPLDAAQTLSEYDDACGGYCFL